MKSLVSQLSIATLGNGLEKIISLVVVTFLAHHIDKERLGEFFFAISVCTMAALLNEFGSSRYLVRTVAQDPKGAAAHLSGILRFRLPLLALSLIVIDVVVAFVAPGLLWTFAFTSIYVLFENLYYAFGSTLLGVGAVAARVATGLIGPLVLLALVPAATALGWPFDRIVIVYAVASTGMVAIAFGVVVRRIGPVMLWRGGAPVRDMVAQCSLLFAVSVVVLLHSRIDEWMLAALRDFREVAGYAAAYKLIEAARMVIRPITMVLVPFFAAAMLTSELQQVRTHATRTLWITVLIGIAVAGGVIAIAPWVVPLLFGHDYPETVTITRVLFLAAPAFFVGQVAMLLKSSLHLDRETLALAVISVVLNFALNLIAIPRWGAIGAAWTTLITESVFAVALVVVLMSRLGERTHRYGTKPLRPPLA